MKKSKKVIAVLLAVVMLFAAVPSFAAAEEVSRHESVGSFSLEGLSEVESGKIESGSLQKNRTSEFPSDAEAFSAQPVTYEFNDFDSAEKKMIEDFLNAQGNPEADKVVFYTLDMKKNAQGDLEFYGIIRNGFSTTFSVEGVELIFATEDGDLASMAAYEYENTKIATKSSLASRFRIDADYVNPAFNPATEDYAYVYIFYGEVLQTPFMDIFMWAQYDIEWAYLAGIMNGTGPTKFSPSGTLERAMLATILWRMQGSPAPSGEAAFTDVPAGKYYTDAVAWAAENEIVSGYENMTFKPTDKITRQQFATMLYRYAQKYGNGTDNGISLDSYPDSDKVSEYARSAMEWAVGNGIITGKSGKLEPAGQATRAEAATMLSRYAALG